MPCYPKPRKGQDTIGAWVETAPVQVIDDSHSDSNPEAGVDDDKMHIVMEYVEGGSLQVRYPELLPSL